MVISGHTTTLTTFLFDAIIMNVARKRPRKHPYKVYAERTNRANPYLWQCGHCGRMFTQKGSILEHCRRYHSELRWWQLVKLGELQDKL